MKILKVSIFTLSVLFLLVSDAVGNSSFKQDSDFVGKKVQFAKLTGKVETLRLASQNSDSEQNQARITLLFTQIEKTADMEKCWSYISSIKKICKENLEISRPLLSKYVSSQNQRVQLFAAYLKFVIFDDIDIALETSIKILEESTDDELIKMAGSLICKTEEDDEDFIEDLSDILDDREEEFSDYSKVQILRTIFYLGDDDALEEIMDYTKSKDRKISNEAVLTIAELDEPKNVLKQLKFIASQPNTQGLIAKTILENLEIQMDIENIKKKGKANQNEFTQNITPVPGQPDYSDKKFINSCILTVNRYMTITTKEVGTKERGDYKLWTEKQRLEPKYLIDQACQGMAKACDKHCRYETGREMILEAEDMQGSYGGLGARVEVEGEYVKIVQPFYSYFVVDSNRKTKKVYGPAYAAGLRSGDKIIGYYLKNKYIDFKGWSLQDVIKTLKGEPGTPVKVNVMRRGWSKPKKFTIIRAQIHVSTALYEMLPGKIGYIRLTQFGYNTAQDLEDALIALEEEGVKSIILDLRDNPGGSLPSVLDSIDIFLEGNKRIATMKGRWGKWKDGIEFETENRIRDRKYPMAVLINENSASGSDLTSGALQDYDRAVIIGDTSYGKGVGQSFFYLMSSLEIEKDEDDPAYSGFTRWLRLTTFEYFLPSGRSINDIGVTPDIFVDDKVHFKGINYSCEYDEWLGWQLAEIEKLLAKDKPEDLDVIDEYILKHFEGNKEKFAELCKFDNYNHKNYPGFDEWYEKLNTKLSKDDARKLLQRGQSKFRNGGLQLAVADERGKEFIQNFAEDTVLQRSIYEVAKKINLDINKIKEYKKFAKNFN